MGIFTEGAINKVFMKTISSIAAQSLHSGVLTEEQCQTINRLLFARMHDAEDLCALDRLMDALIVKTVVKTEELLEVPTSA